MSSVIPRLNADSFPSWSRGMRRPFHDAYLAMYSSVFGGIVTDPVLMLVPLDDHVVHRGDGVFETFKCVEGALYNLEAHLERLVKSAQGLKFSLPASVNALRAVVLETVRVGGRQDCLVRMIISRGPGSFGVNPYDCPRAELYVVVTAAKPPFMELHPEGARLGSSRIPVKPSFFAGIKSCNYLPNVLMAREAADAGVHFMVAFDAHGCLAESATENVGIVTRDRRLLFPALDGILCGTTMMRVVELAQPLVRDGLLREVAFRSIPRTDMVAAAEILVVGTTPNVTFVREFDGRPVGDGRPGPVFSALSQRLLDDIRCNPDMRTPVF